MCAEKTSPLLMYFDGPWEWLKTDFANPAHFWPYRTGRSMALFRGLSINLLMHKSDTECFSAQMTFFSNYFS